MKMSQPPPRRARPGSTRSADGPPPRKWLDQLFPGERVQPVLGSSSTRSSLNSCSCSALTDSMKSTASEGEVEEEGLQRGRGDTRSGTEGRTGRSRGQSSSPRRPWSLRVGNRSAAQRDQLAGKTEAACGDMRLQSVRAPPGEEALRRLDLEPGGFPGGPDLKNPPAAQETRSIPGRGRVPWRRK